MSDPHLSPHPIPPSLLARTMDPHASSDWDCSARRRSQHLKSPHPPDFPKAQLFHAHPGPPRPFPYPLLTSPRPVLPLRSPRKLFRDWRLVMLIVLLLIVIQTTLGATYLYGFFYARDAADRVVMERGDEVRRKVMARFGEMAERKRMEREEEEEEWWMEVGVEGDDDGGVPKPTLVPNARGEMVVAGGHGKGHPHYNEGPDDEVEVGSPDAVPQATPIPANEAADTPGTDHPPHVAAPSDRNPPATPTSLTEAEAKRQDEAVQEATAQLHALARDAPSKNEREALRKSERALRKAASRRRMSRAKRAREQKHRG